MLQLCPFCGHLLPKPVADGIASCKNCQRVFDTSPMNRLLSAGWLCRRRNYEHKENLIGQGFSPDEAELVISLVVENQYSPQEFAEELKTRGISELYVLEEAS
jgi:hypothetical protein